jgi:hypothetical protein
MVTKSLTNNSKDFLPQNITTQHKHGINQSTHQWFANENKGKHDE